MEIVFTADNGFEAHNILNLLNQAGIEGKVEGEFLQGAFGELPPAMGMVRVLVDEQDVEAANKVVADWASAQQPDQD
jgi:hypothetical protein